MAARDAHLDLPVGECIGVAQWMHALPYRACDLCEHGRTQSDRRVCLCIDVVLGKAPQPVHIARAPNGQCGPEAKFMSFPGLNT